MRTRAKARKEEGRCYLEGSLLVGDIARERPPLVLFAPDEKRLRAIVSAAKRPAEADLYTVSPSAAKAMGGLINPEGVSGIFALPSPGILRGDQRWLICDGVADPGNLGALIRTAKAFEWSGVATTETSCDPYNDKALRASRGAALLIPLARLHREEIATLQPRAPEILLACAEGKPMSASHAPHKMEGQWLIVGNEAGGVCSKLRALGESVAVRAPGMESLNVACAGAIFMFMLSR